MYRIQVRDNLEHIPRPCDYFDLIGGTSTGGWVYIFAGPSCSVPPSLKLDAAALTCWFRLVALMLGRWGAVLQSRVCVY